MQRHTAEEHVPVPGPPRRQRPLPPATPVRRARPDAGRSFVVVRAGATLGRADDNTIVAIDPAISRRHARVEAQEEELTMVDAVTRHGTWVNGGACLSGLINHAAWRHDDAADAQSRTCHHLPVLAIHRRKATRCCDRASSSRSY